MVAVVMSFPGLREWLRSSRDSNAKESSTEIGLLLMGLLGTHKRVEQVEVKVGDKGQE